MEEPLEGRLRKVILVDKEGMSFRNIVKRTCMLREPRVEARSRKDELEAKVKDLETEKKHLLAEVEVLKRLSIRVRQLEEEVVELTARKAELEEKIMALETERDGLKRDVQELEEKLAVAELEARVAELQTEVRELAQKKKQLEERIRLPEASPAAQSQI